MHHTKLRNKQDMAKIILMLFAFFSMYATCLAVNEKLAVLGFFVFGFPLKYTVVEYDSL